MKRIILYTTMAVFVLPALSTSCYAERKPDVEVRFSPNQGATEAIVDFINSAKTSIRVAAYSFTSVEIAQALVNAHRKGIDVQVVLDKSNETGRYSSATFLTNQNVPMRINSRYKIMHSKYIIIDNISVETGSFNYTKAAENSNAENVIILRHQPAIAQQYENNWKQLWSESKI